MEFVPCTFFGEAMHTRRILFSTLSVTVTLAVAAAVIVPGQTAFADESTALVESFDDGASSWTAAKGSVTASTSTDITEGTAALKLNYDLSAGSVEAGRSSTQPTWNPLAYSALKLDYKGDGTFNTLYLRLRDATGEILYYRLGNLNTTTWITTTLNLRNPPAATTGGNANGVLDAPVSLYRFVVVRNGTQPTTGNVTIDNLRTVSDGWGPASADPAYFAPANGQTATITIPAATAGDYTLTLTDPAGHTRTLLGTAPDATPQTLTWDGTADDTTLMQGNVSAVLAYDTTPDGTLSNSTRIGTPLLTTVAEGDQPTGSETISLAESFDSGADTWAAAVGSVTASTSTDITEGTAALKLNYDLSAGSVEAGRSSTQPTWNPLAYSALKLDYKGDGTFNTLYLRLRDATGEILYYRLGNLNTTTWITTTLNLRNPPAATTGGNANGVLDAPVSLYRFVVVRNGTQPTTGNVTIDNLRTVSDGWGPASADPAYFAPANGQTATITIPAATAGDYTLTLTDPAGHTRTLLGTAPDATPQTLTWDGTADDTTLMQGNVSAVLAYDTTPDGEAAARTAVGTPLLTTVAEVDATSPAVVTLAESFDAGADPWVQAMGSATATASADKTEGSTALKFGYDLSSGTVELGRATTPTPWDATAFSILKLDYKGDGTFNTLYLRLRDATGEVLYYRVATLNTTTWTTATVNLNSPTATSGGNANGVLDAPVALYRLVVVRNGTQAATGSVLLDNLRAIGDGWTAPTAAPAYFSAAASQTTVLSVGAATPGDYAVTVTDASGHSRTLTGTANSAGVQSLPWDGRTSDGTLFEGNISATLAYDTVPDGNLSTPTTVGMPYLGGVTARIKTSSGASTVGVNSSMSTYDTLASADADAKLMESAYVRYAREEFDWNRIEPRQDYFDWAKFDQAVAAAKGRNLDVIGKLGYTADWATSAPAGTPSSDARYFPPSNLDDWVDYVTQTVGRYKDSVSVWEVWNEPNIDKYWKPGPDPAQYGALLTATYSAIKAVQPNATVLIGGLANGFPETFLNALLANGAGSSFDGIAMHMYVSGAPEPSTIDSWMGAAQTFVARKTPGRSLWITEIGWTTCDSCTTKVSEDQQAQFLSRFYIDAVTHGISGVVWFNLRESGTSGSSIDNYGLVERTGRVKPAYTALARFAAATVQSAAAGVINPSSNGTSTVVDDFATTSGISSSSLGTGGSTSLQVTTGRIGGAGAIAVNYNYTASTATGSLISMNKPIAGSPTSLSLWAYGDNSNNSVFLKFVDATGEAFEAKIGNVGTPKWARMVFYFDGNNPNYTHSGGNNDGVVNYPITVTQLHVYKSANDVNKGQFIIDDLTAHYGAPVRGAIFFGRSYNTQAIYTISARDTKLAVPNTTAYIYDRGTVSSLPVSGGLASVTITPTPKFVIATPATNPVNGPKQSPVTLSLVTGDRSVLTIQVYTKAGALVRTLAANQSYLSGPRTVTWDARLANGDWAAAGAYIFRIQTTGADGTSTVVTRNFTLN